MILTDICCTGFLPVQAKIDYPNCSILDITLNIGIKAIEIKKNKKRNWTQIFLPEQNSSIALLKINENELADITYVIMFSPCHGSD